MFRILKSSGYVNKNWKEHTSLLESIWKQKNIKSLTPMHTVSPVTALEENIQQNYLETASELALLVYLVTMLGSHWN